MKADIQSKAGSYWCCNLCSIAFLSVTTIDNQAHNVLSAKIGG